MRALALRSLNNTHTRLQWVLGEDTQQVGARHAKGVADKNTAFDGECDEGLRSLEAPGWVVRARVGESLAWQRSTQNTRVAPSACPQPRLQQQQQEPLASSPCLSTDAPLHSVSPRTTRAHLCVAGAPQKPFVCFVCFEEKYSKEKTMHKRKPNAAPPPPLFSFF